MGYVLETRGLVKEFKGQRAVDGVSLHVPEGAVYGLLGPNGAGKSTLLKMVCGMLRPSAGEILVAGRPWTRSDLAGIGALIETPPLYENLTARENLLVRTTLLGVGEERIDEALATVELTNTGKKRAGQFSLGMKQRLGIALALVGHPRLLVLDEPTNGLDPVGIQELRALIRSFPQRGITVVLSSHILGEVEHVADLVGIIVGGRLAYEAPLDGGQDLERLFMDVCMGKAVA
ncbi:MULTISPECIES: lantibiotic protection ABC transporter ATP-binding protein [Gordonibacter]|uniref:Lantibiotic protection ABC transporter ATP-binding protein n=1 Tax=Gordonibacter faecis TaxID=3047475 RepID=A0ABT7DNV0_9ACTN|nr:MULTISPECIES: lantibiotic protection ABC transporter ATP-binding protein [unclassified Gordonibacter]MDJ1651219.1 lantibiotic protection ABC transporter ATP-binding protein [Gordonibacter sp. KGMB12511]HIW77317.1 lantibiotic protection ABC transporter ATP-binding protein [Candidatus Gordonibacter avicola]